MVERAVCEAVWRTFEASLINCRVEKMRGHEWTLIILGTGPASTRVKTHKRPEVEKYDLVIPSPFVIDPYAPLWIISLLSSL